MQVEGEREREQQTVFNKMNRRHNNNRNNFIDRRQEEWKGKRRGYYKQTNEQAAVKYKRLIIEIPKGHWTNKTTNDRSNQYNDLMVSEKPKKKKKWIIDQLEI